MNKRKKLSKCAKKTFSIDDGKLKNLENRLKQDQASPFFDKLVFSKGKGRALVGFPPAARRMDTLNDLLAASDLISLHCALTDETVQIINGEFLQQVKTGILVYPRTK